ncbi:hypothetical protein BXZ70DRAFT_947991 [Cristinia sonorae]|uniref:MYND-type domain-containing protein n=1 Tax=Cristinia sonorae TaxID=1940300 RepID=A0A8K0UK03_9AGAR|nr:hypothetical protein BXZ70DRAFT_947991 [Cristinia sonorae]
MSLCRYLASKPITGPPLTRFATVTQNPDGTTSSSINWLEVVQHEPDNVATWLLYLHFSDRLGESDALLSLIDCNSQLQSPPAAANFAASHLPCAIVHILGDPEMFDWDYEYSPKSFGYSMTALIALHACLTGAFATRNTGLQWESDVANRISDVEEAIWRGRGIVRMVTRFLDNSREPFSPHCDAVIAVLYEMVALRDQYRWALSTLIPQCLPVSRVLPLLQPPRVSATPFPARMADIFLFIWSCGHRSDEERRQVLNDIVWLLHRPATPSEINSFVYRATHPSAGYLGSKLLLINNMSKNLYSEKAVEETGFQIVYLCSTFFSAEPEVFRDHYASSSDTGFPRGLLVHSQRQLCSSSPDVHNVAIPLTLAALSHLGAFDSPNSHPAKHLKRYAGDLNFVATVRRAIHVAVEAGDVDGLITANTALDFIAATAQEYRNSENPDNVQLVQSYHETSTYMWHNFLQTIRAIPTKDTHRTAVKAKAIKYWKKFGKTFDLEEGGKHPSSVSLALSTTESHPRYWLFKKRCGLPSCGCHVAKPEHHLRVCKGCYRILYCSKYCQDRDWSFGHRYVCRSEGAKNAL